MEKTDEHLSFDAVIVAAGDFPQHPLPLSILHDAPRIICCDGAAQTLLSKGIIPHAIVGDGDSLPIHIKEQYPHLVHTVKEQKYNDLTKSTRYVVEKIRPAHGLVAYLGCTGKREDHTLGNISLLSFYLREFHIQPIMYTDQGFFTPAIGTQTFSSFPGQQISIFRIHCKELSSEGLRWDAYPFSEWWEGTLNEALANSFTIHSDGEYIVFRTYGLS